MSTIRDEAGELPVHRDTEVRCPWCQAKTGGSWSDAVERAIVRDLQRRQREHRGEGPKPLRLDERDETVAELKTLRAGVKACCESCDKPFRVVRIDDLGTHVMHGARSDKDEEYLAWKAQQASRGGDGT